jgi:hypothetical protein
VSFTAVRPDGVAYTVSDAQFGGSEVLATSEPVVPWVLEVKVLDPAFTGGVADTYKNHGDYVSSQGGGADGAHSPIGMPVNSGK